MAVSDSQKRASDKYNREKTDRVLLRFPKGELEDVRAFASEHGESVNAFILKAVRKAMENSGLVR